MSDTQPETQHDAFLAKEYVSLWKSFGVDGLKGELHLDTQQPPLEKPSKKAPKSPATPIGSRPTLEEIRKRLGSGCGCTLCPTKINLVFGDGNPKARLMFVGEGPGADEDAKGIPFVGRAGQLLNKIIEAMGYKREDVYIANIVKCRPPQNRQPTPEEITTCSPFLREQIEAIAPELIVALGATAALTLVGTDGPLSAIRGKIQKLTWNESIPVLPTYHPAYLLRNPPAKKIVWEDMKIAIARLETRQ